MRIDIWSRFCFCNYSIISYILISEISDLVLVRGARFLVLKRDRNYLAAIFLCEDIVDYIDPRSQFKAELARVRSPQHIVFQSTRITRVFTLFFSNVASRLVTCTFAHAYARRSFINGRARRIFKIWLREKLT